MGAIPITDDWDGNVEVDMPIAPEIIEEKPVQTGKQLSLFDDL